MNISLFTLPSWQPQQCDDLEKHGLDYNANNSLEANPQYVGKTSLDKLPLAVLFQICLYLDFNDICNLCCANKLLKGIGNEALNYKRKYNIRSPNCGLISRKWEEKLIYAALKVLEPHKLALSNIQSKGVFIVDPLLAIQQRLMRESSEYINMITNEEEIDGHKNDTTNELEHAKKCAGESEVEECILEQDFSELSKNLAYINRLKLNDFDLSRGSGDIYMNATSDANDSNDNSTLLGNNNMNGSISTPKLLDFEENGENSGKFEINMQNDQIILPENNFLDELHFVNSIPDTALSDSITNQENSDRRLHNVSRPDFSDTTENCTNDIFDKRVRERRNIFESGAPIGFIGNIPAQLPTNSYEMAFEEIQEETCGKILAGLEELTDLSKTMSTKAKIKMFESASQQTTSPLQKTASLKESTNKQDMHNAELGEVKKIESTARNINTKLFQNTFRFSSVVQPSEKEEDMQDDDSYSNSSFELIRQLQMSTKVKDKRMLFETLVEKTNELSLGNSKYRKHSKKKRLTERVFSNTSSIQHTNNENIVELETPAQCSLTESPPRSSTAVEQVDLSLLDDFSDEKEKLEIESLPQSSSFDAYSNLDTTVAVAKNETANETANETE